MGTYKGQHLTIDEVRLRLPSYLTIDGSTYIDTQTKARFIDEKYGEFWRIPNDIFSALKKTPNNSIGHKQRSRDASKSTYESLQNRMPKHLKIKQDTFNGSVTPCIIIDSEYGEFLASPCLVVLKKAKHPDRPSKKQGPKYDPEDIQKKLPSYISLVKDTYINITTKCSFIDTLYGEFTAIPDNVIRGHGHPDRGIAKKINTNISRYGCRNPLSNQDVYRKTILSSRNLYKKTHWETNEGLLCRGTWEAKVVDYLNQNKIRFEWQIRIDLPSGNKYYVDLFLSETNTWVEIKGWLDRDNETKEKWLWFHENYPNSELWQKEKLKSLGIL